jgi:hypothetical protein
LLDGADFKSMDSLSAGIRISAASKLGDYNSIASGQNLTFDTHV